MLRNVITTFFFLLIFTGTFQVKTFAQASSTVMNLTTTDAKEGEDYSLSLQLYQSVSASKAYAYYRAFGESEFKQGEMRMNGSVAEYTIPASKVSTPYLEVYFSLTLANGTLESYPIGAPDKSQPLQIRVLPSSPKDKEAVFLSPEKGKVIGESDFFVSISLLRASNEVNKAATKIYIDDVDVTSYVVFAEDLLLFYADNFPKKFSFGNHSIKVELYDNSKQLYHTAINNFKLASDRMAEEAAATFTHRGNVSAEGRNENVGNRTTWYNNLNLGIDGSYKNWEMNAQVYMTSEEKKFLQPYDRFTLNVASDWLSLNVGDHTPNYPSLIVSGKRIRGVTGGISLGFLNVTASYGQINKGVELGKIITKYQTGDSITLSPNVISIDSAKFGAPKALVSDFGTYSRNVFAIRPSFGKGENFQLGFTYMHSADDPNSIDFGVHPQENLVLGTDILIGMFDQKILFTGQAAMSIINTDISGGNIDDASFRSFLKDANVDSVIIDRYMKFKTFGEKFMTINQFLKPLNPEKFSTASVEGALALNLGANYFKGGYIYRGNDFASFTNSYVRTNIAGINLTDRVRLLENKLFVSAGYELLHDNLQNTGRNTNKYESYSGSISFFPRSNLPNFLISYMLNNNTNDDTSSIFKINDGTSRIFIQTSYDFNFIKHHQVSLGYSVSERDDKSFRNLDANNYSVNLGTSTNWDDKLQSSFAVNLNHSLVKTDSSNSDQLNYSSLSIGVKYILLNDKLSLNGTFDPSFGDFERIGLSFVAQYLIMNNFSVQFSARYIKNTKMPNLGPYYNDSIVGLSTRYSW